MSWLNSLTAAISTENIDQMMELLDSMPEFENLQQMEEAYYLLQSAYETIEQLKAADSILLAKLKNSMKFFEEKNRNDFNSLDVTY